MFEIVLNLIGYLPQEFAWIYIVIILLILFFLFGIILKLLGGDL